MQKVLGPIRRNFKTVALSVVALAATAPAALAQSPSPPPVPTVADASEKVTALSGAMTTVTGTAFVLVGAIIGTGLLVWGVGYLVSKARGASR